MLFFDYTKGLGIGTTFPKLERKSIIVFFSISRRFSLIARIYKVNPKIAFKPRLKKNGTSKKN